MSIKSTKYTCTIQYEIVLVHVLYIYHAAIVFFMDYGAKQPCYHLQFTGEIWKQSQIARQVGPTLAQRGADRIHIGPTWGQQNLLSEMVRRRNQHYNYDTSWLIDVSSDSLLYPFCSVDRVTLAVVVTACPYRLIQGLYSLRIRRLISMGIPIINLRRSSDRLRFIMGIPIPVRRRLLSE